MPSNRPIFDARNSASTLAAFLAPSCRTLVPWHTRAVRDVPMTTKSGAIAAHGVGEVCIAVQQPARCRTMPAHVQQACPCCTSARRSAGCWVLFGSAAASIWALAICGRFTARRVGVFDPEPGRRPLGRRFVLHRTSGSRPQVCRPNPYSLPSEASPTRPAAAPARLHAASPVPAAATTTTPALAALRRPFSPF